MEATAFPDPVSALVGWQQKAKASPKQDNNPARIKTPKPLKGPEGMKNNLKKIQLA
jgi:hypothetical protein